MKSSNWVRPFLVLVLLFCGVLHSLADALDNWAIRSSGVTNYLVSVAYGGGTFVAVGNLGTILTSPDGIIWSRRSSGTTNPLYGMTYGNGTFVAVGEDFENASNTLILASSNGATWTRGMTQNTGFLVGVTFANNIFVAVGQAGGIVTSVDGVAWTNQNSGTNNPFSSVTYGNDVFLAVGSTNTVATSADGLAWTSRSAGISEYVDVFGTAHPVVSFLSDAAYGNGTFVSTGQKLFLFPALRVLGMILISSNGQAWTEEDYPGIGIPFMRTPTLSGVTYGNGIFVAVGDSGLIVTSTDGVNWNRRGSGLPVKQLYRVTYAQSTFVAVGEDGVILQSGSFAPAQLAIRSRPSNGGFELSITGEIGRSYRVQATENLAVPSWVDLFTFNNSQDTITVFLDSRAGLYRQRFYRVVSR